MIRRMVAFIVCLVFIVTGVVPVAMGQQVVLPPPGKMVALSPASAPCVLRGMRVDAKDPLRMDFLFDEGRAVTSQQEFNDVSLRLIKYFLVSLTIPSKDLWVNLSPYESQRIVQEDLGRTAMGRDLLAQDYILKQLTATLLHPDGETGRAFWKEVYRRAYEAYGTTDIPVDTFNKVWIMPGRSLVHEMLSPDGNQISAFVDNVELKVMLESDYVAMSCQKDMAESPANALVPAASASDSSAVRLAKGVLREVVVPVLEKEVNEGVNFAPLRQIVHSLVLSAWLKKKLMSSAGLTTGIKGTDANVFAQVFIDRHKTLGNEIAHPQEEGRQIYDRYVEAFRKGAYNLIKEEVDAYSQELIPRQYFSGGFTADHIDASMDVKQGPPDYAQGKYTNVLVVLKWLKRMTEKVMSDKETAVGARKCIVTVALLVSLAVTGWCSFHPFLSQRGKVDVPASHEKLDGPSMYKIVQDVTERKQFYDSGIIHAKSARVTPEAFLGGVLVQPIPSDLSPEDREKAVKERSERLALIIDRNVQTFGKDLLRVGLSEKDIALLVTSIMARESEGNALAVQLLPGGVKQARGASQYEFRSWWDQLHIAEDALKDFPGEFQDFYRLIQEEKRNPRGSLKKNSWISDSTRDMVVSSEMNLRMMVILLDYMVDYRPVSIKTILNEADAWLTKKFYVVLPADIQQDIDTPVLTLAEVMQQLANDQQFDDISNKRVLMYLLALEWNGGKNRTAQELRAAVHYERLSGEERINYQESALKDVAVARKDMMLSMGRVYQILKSNNVKPGPIFAKDLRRSAALVVAYEKIQEASSVNAETFVSQWCAFRRAEKKYLVAYDNIKVCQSAHYAEIILSLTGISNKNPYDLGLVFRKYRDMSNKNMTQVRRDMEAARAKILADSLPDGKDRVVPVKMAAKVKAKDVDAKVKVTGPAKAKMIKPEKNVAHLKSKKAALKARAVGTRAKANPENKSGGDKSQVIGPYGGIDLTDQAAGMHVQGEAGAFRFDLSPADIKALEQDVQGMMPLIINVQPVNDVRMFLGFDERVGTAS